MHCEQNEQNLKRNLRSLPSIFLLCRNPIVRDSTSLATHFDINGLLPDSRNNSILFNGEKKRPIWTPIHLSLQLVSVFLCQPVPLQFHLMYTVSQKKTRHPTHVDNFAKNWSIFKDSFNDRLVTKFSKKYILYSPPYLTDVAALLCETAMFQKWYKFRNTLSKDVVLKYFFRMHLLNFFFSSN